MAEKPEMLFDFYIRHVWHRISRMYNQKASEIGITMSMGFILMNVDKEGTPSTQLGPRMGMEPTSLSRILKNMEDKGLIRREENQQDKRKVKIFLTQSGVDQRRLVRDFLVAFNDKLFAKMPASKVKAFMEVMIKIDDTIEQELKEMNVQQDTIA
jgi:DNA-binding MarR family transcriptional regulator